MVADGMVDFLGQISEEAIIIISDDWKRGKENKHIADFLHQLLKLVSLGLSKHMQEHVEQMGNLLLRLTKRIETSSQKKPS